jgi:hypothetical protein
VLGNDEKTLASETNIPKSEVLTLKTWDTTRIINIMHVPYVTNLKVLGIIYARRISKIVRVIGKHASAM